MGDLSTAPPRYAIEAIREALPAFGRQIKGFDMSDALLTGVETRTSSPVRLAPGGDGQRRNTRGLLPAGEGAGYAGGIRAAEWVAEAMIDAGTALSTSECHRDSVIFVSMEIISATGDSLSVAPSDRGFPTTSGLHRHLLHG